MWGTTGTVSEVVGVLLCGCLELIRSGALVIGDAIRVKIRFQVAVRPRVESRVFCSVGLGRKIRSDRGVVRSSRLGRGRVVGLSLLDELVTVGTGLLGGFLVLGLKPLPARC